MANIQITDVSKKQFFLRSDRFLTALIIFQTSNDCDLCLTCFLDRAHVQHTHYREQDNCSFEAYKSSLDEQYQRELRRRNRSSRGSSRSSSSSRSSTYASVNSVISNKENGGTKQTRRPSGDKNKDNYRHCEKLNAKRKVSKEDKGKHRSASSARSNQPHDKEDSAFISPGLDSVPLQKASSSLTSFLSSSTDISTMSQHEVAVLIANAVDADPEEIRKMLMLAAKAKSKVRAKALPSKHRDGFQKGEKSLVRNLSSNDEMFAENRKVTTKSETKPQSHKEAQISALGSETAFSPSTSHTSPPFKPSSTSSPHLHLSFEEDCRPLSLTEFSSPTEEQCRNTQPELSSYNLTNASVESSVFSHETSMVNNDVLKSKTSPISKHTMPLQITLITPEPAPKFGKTYTIRELPSADPPKQRICNHPLNTELSVQHLQGHALTKETPASAPQIHFHDAEELSAAKEQRDGTNKLVFPEYQPDTPCHNKSNSNPADIEPKKDFITEFRHSSQGDSQGQGLWSQGYGNAVSRGYEAALQIPDQRSSFQGTQQLYVNTNLSPLGMPVAQQSAFSMNPYLDHVVIPGGHPLPAQIGPVQVPQISQHLYGPGNLALGKTVQVPSYNVLGGIPYQHPSVQTVSAGIGTRTSSLVTAVSHAGSAVSNPPFIQVSGTYR